MSREAEAERGEREKISVKTFQRIDTIHFSFFPVLLFEAKNSK